MADVTIYTKPHCPYCIRAKQLLDSKAVTYHEIEASSDPDLRAQMVERAQGRNTFPQIFINDVPVGGCDELYALEKAGKLDSLLQEKPS